MRDDKTVKVTFRMRKDVVEGYRRLGEARGMELTSVMQEILSRYVAEAGVLDEETSEHVKLLYDLIDRAVLRAQELDEAGKFDQDFTLTVFRDLMNDGSFRSAYEKAVGGDAYENGLPGKSPLNMYLGWYIKNAVGADPVLGAGGKPRRVQVRREPIQTYTLLKRPDHQPTA